MDVDLNGIVKALLQQGPLVSFMFAVIWYGVKAYRQLLDKLLEIQQTNAAALIEVVKTNTAAWQEVKEKINANSNH